MPPQEHYIVFTQGTGSMYPQTAQAVPQVVGFTRPCLVFLFTGAGGWLFRYSITAVRSSPLRRRLGIWMRLYFLKSAMASGSLAASSLSGSAIMRVSHLRLRTAATPWRSGPTLSPWPTVWQAEQ